MRTLRRSLRSLELFVVYLREKNPKCFPQIPGFRQGGLADLRRSFVLIRGICAPSHMPAQTATGCLSFSSAGKRPETFPADNAQHGFAVKRRQRRIQFVYCFCSYPGDPDTASAACIQRKRPPSGAAFKRFELKIIFCGSLQICLHRQRLLKFQISVPSPAS